MICPKCGHANPETAHECEKCGIFFIRWMIQQYRRQGPSSSSREALAGPSASRWLKPSILSGLASGLLIGSGLGFLAGRALPHGPVPAWKTYAEVQPPGREAHRRCAALAKEVEARTGVSGMVLEPQALSPYFLQGFNSFTVDNLKAAAAGTRDQPERATTSPEEYYARRADSPFKCLLQGRWSFLDSPPPAMAGAQECWAVGSALRAHGNFRSLEFFWERLAWSDEKESWALFTPEQDRRLFRRHIDSTLGRAAERADLEKSKALLNEAGHSPQKMTEALLVGFRTLARREGARMRLEKL